MDQGLGFGALAAADQPHLDLDGDGALGLVGPQVAALDLDLAPRRGDALERVAPGVTAFMSGQGRAQAASSSSMATTDSSSSFTAIGAPSSDRRPRRRRI